eukprot:3103704-Prymnesium_polylepis.1
MRAARGLHTQRAGAAIGWRSRISLARVRVGRGAAHQCATVGAQRPRGRPFVVARQLCARCARSKAS